MNKQPGLGFSGEEARDFAEDIRIHKYRLDDDCEQHPSLYHYWSARLAEAKSALDAANDQATLIRSERELSIRADMERGIIAVKQTEGTVKACLDTDEKVLTSRQAVRDAQTTVYELQAAVYSLDHRKSQLDNLVQLLVRGMYAKPAGGPPSDLGTEVQKGVRANLNKGRDQEKETD